MAYVEKKLNIPQNYIQLIFGQFDKNIKKIERAFSVEYVIRGDDLIISGEEALVEKASDVIMDLSNMVSKQETISEQSVDYAISLKLDGATEKASDLASSDVLCHTISGRAVKPKTFGQRKYVEAIDKNMIIFGTGPAGTGKTYLAMAKAITAFKKNEVERIILTRPAIEAGEKLGFLPGDLQSKIDPYLRPLYDALYEIM